MTCTKSSCLGGFTIDGTHISRDLGFAISGRELSAPVLKSARKTVPFTNGSYDFSMVYGQLFYEDRELTYSFDVIGCPKEVEAEVARLLGFLSSVHEADIHDDDRPYYHFRGSYGEAEVEWDESGEAATVTVTFLVYPFLISDDVCEKRVEVGDNVIENHGQPTRITVVPDGTMTIQIGALKQTFNGETVADIALGHGENTVKVTGGGGVLKWNEEVM